jgi:hypothetical protein
MKDSTKLSRFRTNTGESLKESIVQYCAPDGNLDAARVRTVFSLAGLQPSQTDSELLMSTMQYTHLLNQFYDHGGSTLFVAGASAPKKRARSPRRSKKN